MVSLALSRVHSASVRASPAPPSLRSMTAGSEGGGADGPAASARSREGPGWLGEHEASGERVGGVRRGAQERGKRGSDSHNLVFRLAGRAEGLVLQTERLVVRRRDGYGVEEPAAHQL